MEKIEHIILENLITDDDFTRQVLPHLKEEYFEDRVDRVLFEFISKFFEVHNKHPSKKILKLISKEYKKFTQEEYDKAVEVIENLSGESSSNLEWLIDRTERFCKENSIHLALIKSIEITDGIDKTLSIDAIPSILQEALSVSFDKRVGHDYFDDSEVRWEFYHTKEQRVPFHLEIFNKITKGGLPKKTLSVLLAGTNVGKSLFMCDHAAHVVKSGKNALYITLEMAEERIAERVDCNILGCTLDDLDKIRKEDFVSKIGAIKNKTKGKFLVKEYPTAGANVSHFRALLEELKLKKNFIPDIIYIDYLNICSSQRYKAGSNANTYTIVKGIAEEVRALAIEYNVPVLSATQTTRNGNNNSDIEITDTSECIWENEEVELLDNSKKKMKDIRIGDKIKSNDLYKTVTLVHHPKIKDCVKITLKSGKTLIVSKDHVFPSDKGRVSVNNGLTVGNKLHSKS